MNTQELMAGFFPIEVKEVMLELSAGKCQCRTDCLEPATEFHHMISNTKTNRELYPLFVKSIFNCCPIAHGCHMTKTLPRIDSRYAEAYEWFLSGVKAGTIK